MFRIFYSPSVGVPVSDYAGMGLQRGHAVTVMRSTVTFKKENAISRMQTCCN